MLEIVHLLIHMCLYDIICVITFTTLRYKITCSDSHQWNKMQDQFKTEKLIWHGFL